MGEHQILFLAGPPDLSDPRYLTALRELFAVNPRNVLLLAIYFLVLLAIDVAIFQWLTRGFTRWNFSVLGWAVLAGFTLLPLLPLWRLAAEEGPHFAYRRPPEAFARLQPVRGMVVRHGVGVSMGRPLPKRQLHWRLEQPPAEGSTPYLPQPVALRAPPGTPVWVAVDPAGAAAPLFLGFGR